MRPIVNMPEEDRATDIGNMHKQFGKDRMCGSGDIRTDRQTDGRTHHDIYNRSRGRSKQQRIVKMLFLPHQLAFCIFLYIAKFESISCYIIHLSAFHCFDAAV